jgi:hypothetical protein
MGEEPCKAIRVIQCGNLARETVEIERANFDVLLPQHQNNRSSKHPVAFLICWSSVEHERQRLYIAEKKTNQNNDILSSAS